MNGAVSKVNKKLISHLTRAQRTPSAAATVQVSHALPAVRSLVLTAGLRGHLGNWPRSPAVSMRSDLLVAHEKLGQLPLLTVYVVPV